MPITERTLKRWRREVLVDNELKTNVTSTDLLIRVELNKRILRLTQELLDLHLIKK